MKFVALGRHRCASASRNCVVSRRFLSFAPTRDRRESRSRAGWARCPHRLSDVYSTRINKTTKACRLVPFLSSAAVIPATSLRCPRFDHVGCVATSVPFLSSAAVISRPAINAAAVIPATTAGRGQRKGARRNATRRIQRKRRTIRNCVVDRSAINKQTTRYRWYAMRTVSRCWNEPRYLSSAVRRGCSSSAHTHTPSLRYDACTEYETKRIHSNQTTRTTVAITITKTTVPTPTGKNKTTTMRITIAMELTEGYRKLIGQYNGSSRRNDGLGGHLHIIGQRNTVHTFLCYGSSHNSFVALFFISSNGVQVRTVPINAERYHFVLLAATVTRRRNPLVLNRVLPSLLRPGVC